MHEDNETVIAVRRKILALKEEIIGINPEVAGINEEAVVSLTRARSALFQAWTLIVGRRQMTTRTTIDPALTKTSRTGADQAPYTSPAGSRANSP